MPNIGTVLKQEIARLSRRESRSQIDPTRKATAQHRRDLALLKRQVAQLERQVKYLSKRTFGNAPAAPADESVKRVRFVAKGLRAQRIRLGLSAQDYGKLVGVSAQSIYNWESESTRPGGRQLLKLSALREIGKREAAARLERLVATKAKTRGKT